jgi:hypothetical protein
VYDFGSRNKKRGAPRAIWYGLELVRYVLERAWLGDLSQPDVAPRRSPYLRGIHISATFERYARALSKQAKRCAPRPLADLRAARAASR